MAGSSFDNDDGSITDINVTPLVDVMLVLLVIFMVTANYIAHQAVTLELPKSSSGETIGEKNLNFALDRSSQLYLDGKPLTFEKLGIILKEEASKGRRLQALISADKNTPHGSVIKLMDVIKKNGITNIAFNVEMAQEGK